ncbi:maltokinase N-terminal cap-like domain-containing protein, partial [Ornithinicoccus halotolerans]|uniref:maltokinase N-terminal cap-like domain-containing protein n=1 Tax=Ornithinicoccus halotolerans TaxID=1748220 RepID=UPI002B21067E
MTTSTPDSATTVTELLEQWLGARRWYAGKGRAPRLRSRGVLAWPSAGGAAGEDAVRVESHLVTDESGPEPVLYHVPLTLRADPVEALHTALVGTVGEGGQRRYVYDGCQDQVYVQALLDTVHDGREVPAASGQEAPSAAGHPVGQPAPRPEVTRAAVLTGEQSNTSVIVETASGPRIVKVFRVLHPGDNPDVAVQAALAEGGSQLVPQPMGYLQGRWPAPDGHGVETGHLAFAQEFLPGVQDAWRTALEAAREDRDFTDAALTLGEATAGIHAQLRAAFGSTAATDEVKQQLLARMRRRLAAALEAAPQLAEQAAAVESLYDRAAEGRWPSLQRIHGDYHLGQVLDVPGRGWVVVDFEGEPLRPLAERTAPDLVLRDVAGMLRSLDYAAGSVGQEHDLERSGWKQRCRAAFLEGYAAGGTSDDPGEYALLLAALEVDKALYEVVYEARNRPAWMPIPLAAVSRLLARHGAPAGTPAGTP